MRRQAAFTLVELMTAMAIAVLLASMAVQTWSSHRERAQRTSARAALIAAMTELERLHAYTGKNSAPADLSEHAPGYHLRASLCEGRTPAHCIEVIAQPLDPATPCGALILRSTGERFTQLGNARQSASPACWP
ncbi:MULTISPECIES: type IV pilin protein [Ralstonia]|jgi:type IV pilus assembly protein PilE|uniref:type IV pilin protein n=1 Tax=Ralstonia TaxID=48736 RepID=UPI001E4C5F43|nr:MULTISPECIES: prepilin-type N-terminal cleavage/methylation domain-containing protein [unclassified Ralstonia]